METPERDYYKRLLGGDAAGVTEPADFESWFGPLGIEGQYRRGGRYFVVAETLARKRVARLVEIGCGSGANAAYMRRYADEAVGCDIFLAPHLRQSYPDGLRYLEFDANQHFPFEDGSCSAIVAMMVLEHLFDPFHFVDEIRRVLATDGLLFLNVPLVTTIKNRLRLLVGTLPVTADTNWFAKRAWDGAHLHYFNLAMLTRLLQTADLEIVNRRPVGRMFLIKSLFPSLFCAEISVVARRASGARSTE